MLPYYWNGDYMDIRDGLFNSLKLTTEITDPDVLSIMNTIRLRPVKPGTYPVKVRYTLPGKNIITSAKTFMLTNNIKTDAQDL
ncbi:MAG: hypothetical protein HC830_03785 [Bacteroidetes bacterium]|nr:hypothetical protein [Bacteroidota bacterium]